MRKVLIFLVFGWLTISCNLSNRQKLSVKQLTDSAASITKDYTDTTKYTDAIKLFKQAILLDSNDFNSYCKKYFLEFSLGHFMEAEQTLSKLIKFRPDSAELHANYGFLQEFRNDTTESKKTFAKAILLYKATLDTMNKKNPYWLYYWRMSAICTIMMGQEKVVHDLLKENCKTPFDSSFYDIKTLSKTKAEILQTIKSKYSR